MRCRSAAMALPLEAQHAGGVVMENGATHVGGEHAQRIAGHVVVPVRIVGAEAEYVVSQHGDQGS